MCGGGGGWWIMGRWGVVGNRWVGVGRVGGMNNLGELLVYGNSWFTCSLLVSSKVKFLTLYFCPFTVTNFERST